MLATPPTTLSVTPRKKPADEPGERADEGGDADRDDRDERRVGDAGGDPGEDVAAELVGAEEVVEARPLQPRRRILRRRLAGQQPGDREQREDRGIAIRTRPITPLGLRSRARSRCTPARRPESAAELDLGDRRDVAHWATIVPLTTPGGPTGWRLR